MIIDRIMTVTFRATVLRRIRQDGGSTGETFQRNPSVHNILYHRENLTVQAKNTVPIKMLLRINYSIMCTIQNKCKALKIKAETPQFVF